VPEHTELPERLAAVLDAIYAAYTKGWSETEGPGTPEMATEAIWLGRLVAGLMPDEPEAKGLVALMLFAESRRAARRTSEGAYVPLEEQDTSLWSDSMIAEAERLLHAANAGGPSGRYQIEAAIQSAHVARLTSGAPTWPAIAALYDRLLALTSSPVAALNRALAIAEVEGPAPALALVELLEADKRMTSYQPYWAAKGHLLVRMGRKADARKALELAIGLSTDEAARAYLRGRVAALADG
jgi:RNA polymerase sigma-70 factor, ECF subfamily